MRCLHLFVVLCILSLSVATNPESVTCQPSLIISDAISIQCTFEGKNPIGIYTVNIISNNVMAPNTSVKGQTCTSSQNTSAVGTITSTCDFVLSTVSLGPGYHKFYMVVRSNSSYPIETNVTSNVIDIPLPDEMQEPVCDPPTFNAKGQFGLHYGHLTCLAPVPYGHVSCVLNARTNGTSVTNAVAESRGVNFYLPSQNKLNTFAVECNFTLSENHLGPGLQDFQVNMTSTKSDGKSSFKLSNWTTPVLYRLQTAINFTINSRPDVAQANIGDNVTFVCSADGYPPTDIAIHHEPFASTFSHDNKYLEDTSLTIKITDCRQAGKYTCSSTGRITAWDYVNKTMYLEIPCPLLYITTSNETNRQNIGNFLDTFRVSIPVLGSPEPKTMVLQQDAGKAINSDGVSVNYKKDVGPFGNIAVEFSDHELISKRTHFVLKVDNGIRNESVFEFTIQYNAGVSSMLKQMESSYLLFVMLSIFLVRA